MTNIYLISCPLCGRTTAVEADPQQVLRYRAGALAQDAFPDMEPAMREAFISGFCYKCQADIFGSDEDEAED